MKEAGSAATSPHARGAVRPPGVAPPRSGPAACTLGARLAGGPLTVTSSDFTASSLPASSTDRYSTVCRPGSEIANGPVYALHSPPSIRYSVRSTPEPSSDAASVTRTDPSGCSSASAVVTGAVVSSSPVPLRSAGTNRPPAVSNVRPFTYSAANGNVPPPGGVVELGNVIDSSVWVDPIGTTA